MTPLSQSHASLETRKTYPIAGQTEGKNGLLVVEYCGVPLVGLSVKLHRGLCCTIGMSATGK